MIPGLLFQQSPLWFDCSHHSQRGQLISDVRDAAATQRPLWIVYNSSSIFLDTQPILLICKVSDDYKLHVLKEY